MTHQPYYVPQDFYDAVMERSDGSDVTDLFDINDPEWRVMSVTLYKTDDNGAVLSVVSTLALEPVLGREG